MDIAHIQGWGYFFLTAFMAIGLVAYIVHLYVAQSRGTRDYEKYGDIALNDEITDIPVEEISKEIKGKDSK